MQEDERVERVARAMCEADGKDSKSFRLGEQVTVKRGKSISLEQQEIPVWFDYMDKARRFVAAFDVLSG